MLSRIRVLILLESRKIIEKLLLSIFGMDLKPMLSKSTITAAPRKKGMAATFPIDI